MAVKTYTGLTTPNEVLEKMYDFLVNEKGYEPVLGITPDVDIWTKSNSDGEKFVVKNKTGEYYIHFRSANGIDIFGYEDMSSVSISGHINTDTTGLTNDYYGVGMTISDEYDPNALEWYNHLNVPKSPMKQGVNRRVYGSFMYIPRILRNLANEIEPMQPGAYQSICNSDPASFTLHCNSIFNPTETVLFTLMKDVNVFYQCEHLCFGMVNKFGDWDGGIYMSSSISSEGMRSSFFLNNIFDDNFSTSTGFADGGYLPLFGCSQKSNTLLRIDIDNAILEERGDIHWASNGKTETDEAGFTGKKLSTPIRVARAMNGEMPNYRNMQSQSRLDWGKTVSTMNCISVNMPVYFAIVVDPDEKRLYAPVGVTTGIYFTNMLNMQSGFIYDVSYPESEKTGQVFSMTVRRGIYGFDGIAFRQDDVDDSLLRNIVVP